MLRYILLSVISGLLLTISWPTFGFAGFLFVAFIPLLFIEHQISISEKKRKSWRVFLTAYITFLIWNALSYSWLSNARPQYDATSAEVQQAWMAYLIPVVVNALLMTLVFWMYHFVKKRSGSNTGMILLLCLWITFEKLHLNWEFTWPWLNLGNGFASYYKWVQWYEFTGFVGGTIWIWIANFIGFYAVMAFVNAHEKKVKTQFIIRFLLWIFIPLSISFLIYINYEEKGDQATVLAIQPELDPYREKYTKLPHQIVSELLELSNEGFSDSVDIVLTPETSFPGRGEVVLNQIYQDPHIRQIRNWVNQHPNTVFIAGAELIEIFNAKQAPFETSIEYQKGVWYNRYNSVIQIENGVTEIPIYHKSKMVPGVEIFPYQSYLKPILGDAMLDFGGSVNSLTGQREREVFKNEHNKAVVAPLVCYESIYGEFVGRFVKNGANLITVSTNDSWWGNTDGHREFLDYARLRAIENRRDVVRSANSGVSAFINQRGDLIKSLPYEAKAYLKGTVQLNEEKTFYSKYGDVLVRIALLIAGILLMFHWAGWVLTRFK